MEVRAVLFDMDGVIADTAIYHYKAWKKIANLLDSDINEEFNNLLKGVSRQESFDLLLSHIDRELSMEDYSKYMELKNTYFLDYIENLTEQNILPGIKDFMITLKQNNIQIIIASSSENAPLAIEKIGLSRLIDGVVDPSQLAAQKPAPDIFLKAASLANVPTRYCVGIEDSQAGIDAINSANICSISIGKLKNATLVLNKTDQLNLDLFKNLIQGQTNG